MLFEYKRGYKDGYEVGEGERIALATANDALRFNLRELQNSFLKLKTEWDEWKTQYELSTTKKDI